MIDDDRLARLYYGATGRWPGRRERASAEVLAQALVVALGGDLDLVVRGVALRHHNVEVLIAVADELARRAGVTPAPTRAEREAPR